jgi:hypothetical protein
MFRAPRGSVSGPASPDEKGNETAQGKGRIDPVRLRKFQKTVNKKGGGTKLAAKMKNPGSL